jgi:microsomal dipeptidase-like Zn-dependent dipeptidase
MLRADWACAIACAFVGVVACGVPGAPPPPPHALAKAHGARAVALGGYGGDGFGCDGLSTARVRVGGKRLARLGGDYWVAKYEDGAENACHVDTGVRRSGSTAPLTIETPAFGGAPFVTFLVGGGGRPDTRVQLVTRGADGIERVRCETQGPATAEMARVTWALRPGDASLFLRLVDAGVEADTREARRRPILADQLACATRTTVLDQARCHADITARLDAIDEEVATGYPWLTLDAVTTTDRVLADTTLAGTCPLPPNTPRVPAERPRKPTRLWGIADLHTHLAASRGFDGYLFHGDSHPAGKTGVDGMADALIDCADGRHDTGAAINMQENASLLGKHPMRGFPYFDGWPTTSTRVHQEAYVDWVRRAWKGGLRLLFLDVLNNEKMTCAYKRAPDESVSDPDAVVRELADAETLIADNAAWMQRVVSPREAREAIAAGKLAVVLGLEVDRLDVLLLGDAARTHGAEIPDLEAKKPIARAALRGLWDRGVRHIIPIHLIDNALGGAAAFSKLFSIQNKLENNAFLSLGDGFPDGVRYRLHRDKPGDLLVYFATFIASNEDGCTAYPPPASPYNADVNTVGLKPFGQWAIDEMLHMGFLLDVEHMSNVAVEQTFERTSVARWRDSDATLMSSHVKVRDLSYGANVNVPFKAHTVAAYGTDQVSKLASERGRTLRQMKTILDRSGMIGLSLDTVAVCAKPEDPSCASTDFHGVVTLPNDCDGSSKAFAHVLAKTLEVARSSGDRGLGLGSDIDGLSPRPAPRFGPHACFVQQGDSERRDHLRENAAAQRGGVTYESPVLAPLPLRFVGAPENAIIPKDWPMSNREGRMFLGLAAAESGVDLATYPELRDADATGFAKGVRAARAKAPRPWTGASGGRELQGWVAASCWDEWRSNTAPSQECVALFEGTHGSSKAERETYQDAWYVWLLWQTMRGQSPPLERMVAGVRDFDFNIDGMANYGLLPDLLQDLRNIGVPAEDLAVLFRSANDVVDTWEKVETWARAHPPTP